MVWLNVAHCGSTCVGSIFSNDVLVDNCIHQNPLDRVILLRWTALVIRAVSKCNQYKTCFSLRLHLTLEHEWPEIWIRAQDSGHWANDSDHRHINAVRPTNSQWLSHLPFYAYNVMPSEKQIDCWDIRTSLVWLRTERALLQSIQCSNCWDKACVILCM